ncbi:MAG: PHP domain-containing protein [bacterium]
MTQSLQRILQELNAAEATTRLSSAATLVEKHPDLLNDAILGDEVNNHVHTIYSFSPYNPTQVAIAARLAGLRAVGSVDHDTISAAGEMLEAGKIFHIATTVGFELRINFRGTPFADRRLNNPDMDGSAYVLAHGVPKRFIPDFELLLRPIREARRKRNAQQVERLNEKLRDAGLRELVYETDVEGLSQVRNGGTVTERHILYALSRSLIDEFGRGEHLVTALNERLGITLTGSLFDRLSDPTNPHYAYDVLGALKAELVPEFFITPDDTESIPVEHFLAVVNRTPAIPAYAYLGNVAASPTGDKRAQSFEDAYLEELFQFLADIGFQAVTYMPPRNTVEQLTRVSTLARRLGLMEISGVDINSSRQSFNCPEVLQPEFRHLIESTWALIAHEKLSHIDEAYGLFSPNSPFSDDPLETRVLRYARIGRMLDPSHPWDVQLNGKTITVQGKDIQ